MSNKRQAEDNNLRETIAKDFSFIENDNFITDGTITFSSYEPSVSYEMSHDDVSIHLINDICFSDVDDTTIRTSLITLPSGLPASTIGSRTGRPPIQLYLTCDYYTMSEYQCFVRNHIELFEADFEDIESNAQGRNKPIILGQVGVRCRHCNILPPRQRKRGAVYFPTKLDGIYQAATNLASAHLGEYCQMFDDELRNHLLALRNQRTIAGGGKKIWAERAASLGVYEDEQGLRFERSLNYRRLKK